MSMASDKKKKKQRKYSPLGLVLIVALAVLILVLNILAFSYSWFTPTSESGKGLSFNNSYKLRSEDCDFTTFKGELVTADNLSQYSGYKQGQVAYNSTALTANTSVTVPGKTIDQQTGKEVYGRVYFRTEIQNNDTRYPSVISLYHHEMPGHLYLAVTYPSNTFHYVGDTSWPDYFIIRNAYVKVKDQNDADGPGLLLVEWFVENRTSSDILIQPNLYLMYN